MTLQTAQRWIATLQVLTMIAQFSQFFVVGYFVFWVWELNWLLKVPIFFVVEAIVAHIIAALSTALAAPALFVVSQAEDEQSQF